jgi:hypothetical protein
VLLASVGSTAPFVGLFGTVWGIYHALVGIAVVGSLSIEKVAGPVGEALIMTAAGIAVAVPAVLAYNIYGKWVAACEAELEGFAHDLRQMVLEPPRAGTEMAFGRLERSPASQPMSDINMTPLIDVMLVLLVIFIVTAPLMTSQPEARPAAHRRRPAERRAELHRPGARRRGPPVPGRPAGRAADLVQRVREAARATPTPRCSCAPTAACPTAAWPS